MAEKLPSANLRFEFNAKGGVIGSFVQVDGKDVADMSYATGKVTFDAPPRGVATWIVEFAADSYGEGSDPMHKTLRLP